MSENKGNVDSVFGAGNAQGDNTDWKTKYEESERQLSKERVEAGRLKKANDEIARLKAENARLSEQRQGEELLNLLSDEEREGLDPAVAKAAAKMIGKGMSGLRAKLEADSEAEARAKAERDANEANNRKREFVASINEKFPGFLDAVSDGGELNENWKRFMRFNKGSVNSAFTSCDMEAISHFVEAFYKGYTNSSVPSRGRGGAADPDPRSMTGGKKPDVEPDAKRYTQAEIATLLRNADEARSRGDYAMYQREIDKYNRILAEGRFE